MPPTPRDGPEAEVPTRRRRWPRRLLVAAGALLLLVVALRAALPTVLERAVPWAGSRYLGAAARVGNVDLGLLQGRIAVTDLAVFAPGVEPGTPEGVRERPWIGLERLAVELSFRDLFSRRVRLTELVLAGPEVNLARDARGALGPQPAPPAAAEEPEPEPEEAPGEPFALWLERVEVRDPTLSIADLTAPDTPLLQLSLQEITLADLRLEGERITLGDLGLAGPVVEVNHALVTGGGEPPPGAGSRGVAAAPPPAAEPAVSAPPPAAAAPASGESGGGYRVERIDVDGAELTWVGPGGPLETRLSFRAEGVQAARGETFPLRLDLEVVGGSLELEGRAGLDPLLFEGTLGWDGLPIPVVLAATAPDLLPWLRTSRTEGALELRLQLEPGAEGSAEPGLLAKGRARLSELHWADPEAQEVDVRVEAVEADLRALRVPLGPPRAEPPPLRVELASLRLVEPHVEYSRPHPALDALLAGSSGTEGEGTPEDEAPEEGAAGGPERGGDAAEAGRDGAAVEVTLDRFELEGGRVRVRDATVEPRFAGSLEKLAVQAQGVRWPGPRAESFTLSALAPDGAPVRIDGSYASETGSLTLDMDRLALPPFDPYASGAAGYRLQGGDASLRTEAKLAESRIALQNRLVLHHLDVAALDPGSFRARFGMSLDLALALLRNRQGDIRLSIPVAIDREGGSVDLGGVLASAFRQALVGALSAPLKLVGAVIPGGGGGAADELDLEFVHAPGAAALGSDQEDAVAGLRRLLRQRPALGARLVGRAGPDDAPTLARQLLEARAAADEELPELDEAGFLARRRIREALATRAGGEEAPLSAEDEAQVARAVAAVEVPESALLDLASERAAAARQALLEAGTPEEAVSVGEPVVPAAPGVTVELEPRAGSGS